MAAARTPEPETPLPAAVPDPMAAITARAGYMMGENVDHGWTPEHAAAWEGLLEVGRTLRREAELRLEQRHDLSISMLGIMGRLARAPRRTLRQTDLADAMGLSLSRVSRIIDILERRGLVTRHPCPSDARATNVELTRTGRARTTAAQDTVFEYVHEAFVEPLDGAELATLADVFTRLVTRRPARVGARAAACNS